MGSDMTSVSVWSLNPSVSELGCDALDIVDALLLVSGNKLRNLAGDADRDSGCFCLRVDLSE